MEEPTTSTAGSFERKLRLLRIAMLGGAVGLILALGATYFLRRPLPDLTRERFSAAQARWQQSAPRDYVIEVEVRGRQPALYRVEVEDGQPVGATINGNAIKQRRSWETWSVPGMFDTLTSDLVSLRERPGQLVVRCAFDETYGFPAKFERMELGTGLQVSWEVVRFLPGE